MIRGSIDTTPLGNLSKFFVLLLLTALTWLFVREPYDFRLMFFQTPIVPPGIATATALPPPTDAVVATPTSHTPSVTVVAPASRPAQWVYSNANNTRTFGNAIISFPSGFTTQGGANIYGDFVRVLTNSGMAPSIISGTEFALGIWPANHQTTFPKSIEIRFTLDAAKASGKESQLEVRMYNPTSQKWQSIMTQFDSARYQLVIQVKEFTPVPKDFDNWGGRTFFGIFEQSAAQHSTVRSTTTPADIEAIPTVNQGANLRAGPGTNYLVTGYARTGQKVTLIGKSNNGSWYKLDTGQWIASFLINNAPPLPIVNP